MGRIIDYPETTSPGSDDYLLLDNSSDGTKKILAGNISPIDPTFTKSGQAPDSKAVGDEFGSLRNALIPTSYVYDMGEWVVGAINANTGEDLDSRTRIRTPNAKTPASGTMSYVIASGFKANFFTYVDDSFNKTGWVTGSGEIEFDGKTSLRIVMGTTGDDTQTDTSISSNLTLTFLSAFGSEISKVSQNIDKINSEITDINSVIYNYKNFAIWVSGGITSADGKKASSAKRIRIDDFTVDAIEIVPDNGYSVGVVAYDSNGTYVGYWVSGNTYEKALHLYTDAIPMGEIKAANPDYKYTIVGSNASGQNIATSEYKHFSFKMLSVGEDKLPSYIDVPYSNGGMSLKAFKELHFTDGTQFIRTAALWVDINDTFYVSETPRQHKVKLFEWDYSVTSFSPEYYSAAFLKDGSILFVFRTQFYNPTATPSDDYRQNPIIYTKDSSGQYNASVIDFGSNLKPTGWLQNIGFIELYNENCLLFAEYTRGNEIKARVWRIEYPIINYQNWSIVAEHEIPTPWESGFKHYHTVQQDPFTGVVYLTSGDNDLGTGIWYTIDGGQTFTQIDEYSRAKYRMLNMVFTEEYIYWASDDWAPNHLLWKVERDANGVIDPNTLTQVLKFPSEQQSQYIATYATIFMPDFNALLILDRIDTNNPSLSTTKIPVRVFDINGNQLYIAGYIERAQQAHSQIGFRTEAITLTPRNNVITMSFSTNYPNHMRILGNADGGTMKTQVNTVELYLHKNADGYNIDYDVIL